jgi:hypothetical protein
MNNEWYVIIRPLKSNETYNNDCFNKDGYPAQNFPIINKFNKRFLLCVLPLLSF